MGSDYAILASRYIKRALFMLCRYPAFSTSYIRKNIDRPDTDPRELEDYENNSAKAKRWRALILVSIYVYNIVRNSCMHLLWIEAYRFTVETEHPRTGFELFNRSQNGLHGARPALEHISCILTNCTRLGPLNCHYGNEYPAQSSLRLAEDFGHLPLYPICNPNFDRYHYTPVTRLDALGTLALAITIYSQFLFGFWLITQQALMPSGDDTIMFITSPKVTAEFYRRRIRSMLKEIEYSYKSGEYRLYGWKHPLLTHTEEMLELESEFAQRSPLSKESHRINSDQVDPSRNHLAVQIYKSSKAHSAKHRSGASSKEIADAESSEQGQSAHSMRHLSSYSRFTEQLPLESLAENCLPIIRTHWWRSLQARITLRLVVPSLFMVFGIVSMLIYIVDRRIRASHKLVDQFRLEMERMNCFLWTETETLFEPKRAVKLSEISFQWTLNSFVNAFVLNCLAACSISLMFAYYWSTIISVGVWMAEMRMFMVASLMATRLQHQRERAEEERKLFREMDEKLKNLLGISKPPSRANNREDPCKFIHRHYYVSTRKFYNLENLRQQFKATTYLFQIFIIRRIERHDKWTHNASRSSHNRCDQIPNKPRYDWTRLNSKSSDRHCARRFLAEILFRLELRKLSDERQVEACIDETDYNVDTLEQIYVNFRLLVDYVRSLGAIVRAAVVFIYLFNYAALFLGIVYRNRFPKLNTEATFLVIFAFLVANYLILMAADLHANARQMHPLVWSLIAQLSCSEKPRVRHLRSLWLKQAIFLENEGGMAMRFRGLRITYVLIIQLMLWTTTIMGIALKHHVS